MKSLFIGDTEHRLLYVFMTIGVTKKIRYNGGINLPFRSKEVFSGAEPTDNYNCDLSLIQWN